MVNDLESYDKLCRIITREQIYDPSMYDDCVQEARIKVWQLSKSHPTASRAYVAKSIKRRVREVNSRQHFTGMDIRRGVTRDPLRRPHDSLDLMLDDLGAAENAGVDDI